MKAMCVLLVMCVVVGCGGDSSHNESMIDITIADDGRSVDLIQRTVDALDLSRWSLPAIQITPEVIVFGQVLAGEVKKKNVNIMNLGDANLEVTGFQFSGNQYYSLSVAADEHPISQETTEGVAFDTPIVFEPNSQGFFKVTFAPIDDQEATATLVVYSNDPKAPETTVLVKAN